MDAQAETQMLLTAVRRVTQGVQDDADEAVEIRVGPTAYRVLRRHALQVTGCSSAGEIRYYGLPLHAGDDLDAYEVTVKFRRA